MNRSFKIITAGWMIIIVCMLLISCGENPSNRGKSSESVQDSKEKAEDHNDTKFNQREAEKDAQYIVDAYSLSLCAIESAKQAVQHSGNKSVKDFAANMIAAHVNINESIEKLAGKKQISIQKGLTEDQLKEIKSYQDKKGREYNEEYLSKTISKHKDAIALYEKAAEKSSDPDIRNFFSSSLSELRAHADMAMNLKDRLK